MNLLGHIRRSYWLPRIALAVVALATLQIAFVRCAMAEQMNTGMTEHCVYCPPISHADIVMECAFPDSNDDGVANTHQGHETIDIPIRPASVLILRESRMPLVFPKINISPPLHRSLNLTHCVQLK